MQLIGQYDSPFVRRVAVALQLYGFDYQHQPWSVFSDAERLAALNPLLRVPALVLDDGEILIDSQAIIDHLDEIADPALVLLPISGPARRRALKLTALGCGLADKAVALAYEKLLHSSPSPVWQGRCETQIIAVLNALESERREHNSPFWFGYAIGHGDIAVACALRFLSEAHPALFDSQRWPALADHAQGCEALPAFQAVVQPFVGPRG